MKFMKLLVHGRVQRMVQMTTGFLFGAPLNNHISSVHWFCLFVCLCLFIFVLFCFSSLGVIIVQLRVILGIVSSERMVHGVSLSKYW